MKKRNPIFIITIIAFIAIISILIINSQNNKNPGEFKKITYPEVQEMIANEENFVLVVSQSTCSHCATYKPKIKTISKEYGLDMYYMDIDLEDKKKDLLKELNLSGSTPTTLFFKNGKETSIFNRLEGDLSNETVIKKLKELGFISE